MTGQTPPAFAFRAAMAFGLGMLRLAPHEFWAMTPRELAAAAEGMLGRVADPMERAVLTELMDRYPDTTRWRDTAGALA
jgi:uncharacterized phage protein (TIGR02216 family)